jgi:hypothetical protein
MIGDESLRQRRLAGPCLGRNCDNPPSAVARPRKCMVQAFQLFVALEQVDSGISLSIANQPVSIVTAEVARCTLRRHFCQTAPAGKRTRYSKIVTVTLGKHRLLLHSWSYE